MNQSNQASKAYESTFCEVGYTCNTKVIKTLDYINNPEIDNSGIPLTHAVLANDVTMVEKMIYAGANVSYRDMKNENLLQIALNNKAFDVVSTIYKADPDLALVDDPEYQLPITLICNIHKEELKLYMNNFEDLCSRYNDEMLKTPEQMLHYAKVSDLDII